MKKVFFFITIFLFIREASNASSVDTVKYGDFGKVFIYKPVTVSDALVLFVSGDGGWNCAPINMTMKLVDQGVMVVGINISTYLKNIMNKHEKCFYPAGDFEELSLYLQKKYKFRNYFKPILMGYSSGATLVYGILAQAPANTFKGAISMAFCPDLQNVEPLCSGNGLKQHAKIKGLSWFLEPSDKLTAPFIVINGLDDKVCPPADIEAYMNGINNGELILIPKVGHGMSVQKEYLPKLLYALNKVKGFASYPEMVSAKNQASLPHQPEKLVTDLPLITLPVLRNDTMPLLIFMSGDGGWTSFDQSVSEKLVEKGIPVIGLDSQKYFWQARTPEETSAELVKVLHYYLTAWNKKSFVLSGYSFGADVIPFMLTRLPADLRYMAKGAVMMSPDPKADFEIHVTDMLSLGSSNDNYNVLAELKKSAALHITCIFGTDEDSDINAKFKNAGASIRLLPGSHHYNNDFNAITNGIIHSFH